MIAIAFTLGVCVGVGLIMLLLWIMDDKTEAAINAPYSDD